VGGGDVVGGGEVVGEGDAVVSDRGLTLGESESTVVTTGSPDTPLLRIKRSRIPMQGPVTLASYADGRLPVPPAMTAVAPLPPVMSTVAPPPAPLPVPPPRALNKPAPRLPVVPVAPKRAPKQDRN
jgi:hypothetical protein